MLDRPFRFPSGLEVPNRLAKASMTERLADPGGEPGDELLALYRRFALGGAGALLTGNVVVDGSQLEAFGNAVLEDAAAVPAFARWATEGKAAGAAMLMQLNHPGRQSMRLVSKQPVAPSAIGLPYKPYFAAPRALDEAEIGQIVARFVRSAELAEQAGFDGVEVHAAHGYLLSEFLSPNVNRRSDRYGGSLRNRARIVLEIVEGIRERVASSFAVGVKLNAGDFVKGGLGQDDAVATVRLLAPLAVDFIEISGGTFERPASFGEGLAASTLAREGYFLEFARRARDATAIPLIVTGGFRSRAAMEAAVATGACDLVGLARPLAVEPDLPRRLLSGAAAAAAPVALALPRGPSRSMMELLWYRAQLERLGQGREPDLRLSPRCALVRSMARDLAVARRYRRRRLAAPAPPRQLASASPPRAPSNR